METDPDVPPLAVETSVPGFLVSASGHDGHRECEVGGWKYEGVEVMLGRTVVVRPRAMVVSGSYTIRVGCLTTTQHVLPEGRKD